MWTNIALKQNAHHLCDKLSELNSGYSVLPKFQPSSSGTIPDRYGKKYTQEGHFPGEGESGVRDMALPSLAYVLWNVILLLRPSLG